MRRLAVVGLLGCLVAVAMGCYSTPVMPPLGLIYSDIKSPLTSELAGQNVPAKRGEATSESVLGLVAWGDCSLDAAARAGGLRRIQYCDYAFFNVLGVYQKFTVIAHGE